MSWEKLSQKEKAELMKLYLKGGVLKLSEMKKHYNSFANGGPTEDEYIAKRANEERLSALERSRTMTEPIVPKITNPETQEEFLEKQKKLYSQLERSREYLKEKGDVRDVSSLSSYLSSNRFYKDDYTKYAIEHINNTLPTIGEEKYSPTVDGKSCMATASGVYCKNASGNQTFKATPDKYGFRKIPESEMLPGDLVQYYSSKGIPEHALIFDSLDEDGKPLYNYSNGGNDPQSIKIRGRYPTGKKDVYRFVGDSADSTKWRQEYRNKYAGGGPLRDEYDNPEQYYDYNTAEEVGGMYDPKSKHWSSRDPRTGMILKNPKHPTFTMAIKEDQSSGYAPFIDVSTGRYFTLNPEEYATAPNKLTLRKVNKFDGNSTRSQSLKNPLGFDVFFDTPENPVPLKTPAPEIDPDIVSYINATENPDSVGWDPVLKGWKAPKNTIAYDKNNLGMGIDRKTNPDVRRILKRDILGEEYISDEDMQWAQKRAIKRAENSKKERYDYIRRNKGTINKPSQIKDLLTIGSIYNHGSGYVANNHFEDSALIEALRNGTDKEYMKQVDKYWEKRHRNERVRRSREYLQHKIKK